MNYQKEYYKLINEIKYQLSKVYLDRETETKFLEELSEIETKINQESDNFDYYEVFLRASKLAKCLSKIILSKKKVILPPYENETFLVETIKKQREDLSKYQQKLKKLKISFVSYFLTGTIFLTAGAYIIDRDSRRPNDKLYLTKTTTYCDHTDSTISSTNYEENRKTEVIIKKITPWVVGDKEAIRMEYTYRINNMSYDEILRSKDYEKIIANLEYQEITRTMSLENYDGMLRYYDPIYEVTEITQDKDNFVEQKKLVSKETIFALFTELLVYLLVIKVNGGPLFEKILLGASDINSTNKIIDSKITTLKLLKKQYHISKQKTLKK